MSWEYEVRNKLSTFLSKKIRNSYGAPPETVAARLKNVHDLIAELDSGGIQVEGCTTVKTPRKYHKEYSQYLITKDTLPADTCFVRLETTEYGDGLDFYANVDGVDVYSIMVTDKNFGFIFRFLGRFEKMVELVQEYRMECEKETKAEQFIRDSYDTWLDQICKQLTLPYAIEKQETRNVLWVKVDNETQFEIAIPYKGFQEIMPEVLNIIKSYEYLHKTSKARVLIRNCRYILDWHTNPPVQE